MRKVLLGMLFCSFIFAQEIKEPQILRQLLQSDKGFKLVEKKLVGNSLVEYVLENKTQPYSPKRFLVIYATADGRYVLMGAVIDGITGKNLTKEKYAELTRVDVGKLPLEDALKFTYGKGGKKLIMFSDPDCPYCRRVHEWLKNQSVELYVFMYPLPMHQQAYDKSVSIVCAGNNMQKLYDDALAGKSVEIKKCKEGEELVKKHMLVGQLVGVGGTPLFITEDGYRIEGANIRELTEYLQEGGKR